MKEKSEALSETFTSLKRINAYGRLSTNLSKTANSLLALMSFMMDDEMFSYFINSEDTRPFWIVNDIEDDEVFSYFVNSEDDK